MTWTWANLLSALRMALIPVFILALLEGHAGRALAVFAIAGFTDMLDGFVARFYKQQSALGSYLDPAADKLLLTVAFVMLAMPNLQQGLQIPVWATVMVITRDVMIVVIALLVHLAIGIKSFPPSRISRWNTAFQVATVICYLTTPFFPVMSTIAPVVLAVMIGLTVGSSIDYGYRFVYRSDRLQVASENAQ